ncbi:Rieske 2Fe-2S domain-containing protein [Streptomyces sp. C11-1]|uniref:Rieske 2Fe-2S domain-containing protein n=1 Tax=Streptomyces durocortorensis TaxID=2811104 RepID=A0ABY9VWW3_9ACTN|nr:Rieske 2Fe-2S domain-containing protein [Streptomyces durocortorensis]WNF25486.1 Rieske 2Fe-2S domain-containing protein [Streptomyces durocortorensis]
MNTQRSAGHTDCHDTDGTSVGACCSPPRAGLKRPAEMSRSTDLPGFGDAEGGLVDGGAFTDAELYRGERGRVFARIRACLDSCPHRGTLVCRADLGSIRDRTCTHHGWSYDLADALVNVPKRSVRPESFDTHAWDPAGVLYVESLHQSIFGTRNPEPVPLREPPGDAAWYREAMFDHDDQGTVVVGGVREREWGDNGKPAPRGLGQSPSPRSRSSAAASCLGGVAGRSPS